MATDATTRPSAGAVVGVDEVLVSRAKAGDLAAYEELVRGNVRRLRAYIALRAPAPHLVDELAQEAFIVAHGKLDKLRPGTPFLAWVRGIAWQLLRRERKRFALDSVNRERLAEHVSILQSLPLEGAAVDGRIERLEICLKKVSDGLRRLLDLRYGDGLASKAIAKQVGESDDAVRTKLSRVRKQLRACVEKGSSK